MPAVQVSVALLGRAASSRASCVVFQARRRPATALSWAGRAVERHMLPGGPVLVLLVEDGGPKRRRRQVAVFQAFGGHMEAAAACATSMGGGAGLSGRQGVRHFPSIPLLPPP